MILINTNNQTERQVIAPAESIQIITDYNCCVEPKIANKIDQQNVLAEEKKHGQMQP